MPKIYERNPDTDEVREREMVQPNQPKPYRNEAAEAVEILARIDKKIDLLFKKAGVEDIEQACILYARYSTIERDDYLLSANAR